MQPELAKRPTLSLRDLPQSDPNAGPTVEFRCNIRMPSMTRTPTATGVLIAVALVSFAVAAPASAQQDLACGSSPSESCERELTATLEDLPNRRDLSPQARLAQQEKYISLRA